MLTQWNRRAAFWTAVVLAVESYLRADAELVLGLVADLWPYTGLGDQIHTLAMATIIATWKRYSYITTYHQAYCAFRWMENLRIIVHWTVSLTCAGVPSLNEAPDDSATLVAGLFYTLALFLREAMLQQDSQIGLILLRILSEDRMQCKSAVISLMRCPFVVETISSALSETNYISFTNARHNIKVSGPQDRIQQRICISVLQYAGQNESTEVSGRFCI